MDLEEVSPLLPSEVGPCLEAALRELNPVSLKARVARVERLIDEASRRAGLLDKLRGRSKERLESAQKTLPLEVFEGQSADRRARVVLDGGFGFVSLSLAPGLSLDDAFAGVREAMRAAAAEVERCWARVLETTALETTALEATAREDANEASDVPRNEAPADEDADA